MHRPLLLDITPFTMHPSDDLFQGKHLPAPRPVCDHYAGSDKDTRHTRRARRTRKQLTLGLPMQARTKTHAASHEIRSTLARGEVERLALWILDSAPANCSAIHNSAVKSPDAFQHSRVPHGKMKIAAACHAPARIASHNVRTNIHDPLAVAIDAIKAAESRPSQRKSTLHDRAGYRYDGAVLQRAKRSWQSMPEAAGALM
jgi:citrate lyase subunit beta/citryl-CoA lyase